MTPVVLAFIFVFGTIIGSFLNAVIWRLRTGETFLRGRSYCPVCRHVLGVMDLVPLLSYLVLLGRCRYCRKGISPRYPTIEAATGLLFLAFALQTGARYGDVFGWPAVLELLRNWYFVSVLMIIFVYDLRYMLILRKVTAPAIALALAANLALGVAWQGLAIGCLIGWGFFMLQILVSKGRWVGGGDVWLGLLLGAMLGWPMVAIALFVAYVAGAVVGTLLLLCRKVGWKSQIPFGTFLAASSLVTLLAGDSLLAWYLILFT